MAQADLERGSRKVAYNLPVAVCIAGAVVSVLLWFALVFERRDQVLESTTEAAELTGEAIEHAIHLQFDALGRLRELLTAAGLGRRPEVDTALAEMAEGIGGVRSVVWIDLDGSTHEVLFGTPSPEMIEGEIALARTAGASFGIEETSAGDLHLRAVLASSDEGSNVLLAMIDPHELLERATTGRARGYAVSVSAGDREIFARAEPSGDAWQGWWRVERQLALPGGQGWQAVFRPTAELAALRLTPVPHYLLAAALVLSLTLGVVTYLYRANLRQERSLEAANRVLSDKGEELERRVSERTEALEDAMAELEAFNYSVSHDLRSPLSAILNFVAILEEDYRNRPLDDDGMEMLDRIQRSASRATDLLEGLLKLSRAGRAELVNERIDMTSVARETFAQTRAAESDPDVTLALDTLPDAMGDRSLLSDVFANLFSNAIKYSRGCRDRTIIVRGEVRGGECVYEVADNGHGFDMRFADKLFGLFERLHASDDVEGTGVGLAMVARVVKRHGGRTWAEGRPEEGARFFFSIPRGVRS